MRRKAGSALRTPMPRRGVARPDICAVNPLRERVKALPQAVRPCSPAVNRHMAAVCFLRVGGNTGQETPAPGRDWRAMVQVLPVCGEILFL